MTDEARVALAQTYADVFTTANGRTVLAHLRAVFVDQELCVAGDPYATHVRVGETRPIRHIDGMLAFAANPTAQLPVIETEEAA